MAMRIEIWECCEFDFRDRRVTLCDSDIQAVFVEYI